MMAQQDRNMQQYTQETNDNAVALMCLLRNLYKYYVELSKNCGRVTMTGVYKTFKNL